MTSHNQEWGRARLPYPELRRVEGLLFDLKGFQRRADIVDRKISQVGKAGLPPLLRDTKLIQ